VAARILFVVIAVLSFAIDRVAKVIVQQQLDPGERVRLLGDWLTLRYVENRGIAFGLFSDLGLVVVFGTLVVGGLLFYFMLHVEPEDLLTIAGGALITGGALGNLVDRVTYRYVVDFISVPRWPTFNVADIAITVGVALVLVAQVLAMIHESRESAGQLPGEQAPGAGEDTP
jgi:signal peptidase II